jgi:GntP family gluconate:H+ symporter
MQIYWGVVPFVLIQVIMVALVIAVPGIVGGGLVKKAAVDTDKLQIMVPEAAGRAGASEDSMENALENALGDQDNAPEPPANEQGAPKGGADKPAAADGAAVAKPPGKGKD